MSHHNVKYLIRDDGVCIVEYSDLIFRTGRFRHYDPEVEQKFEQPPPVVPKVVETKSASMDPAEFDWQMANRTQLVDFAQVTFGVKLNAMKSVSDLRKSVSDLINGNPSTDNSN